MKMETKTPFDIGRERGYKSGVARVAQDLPKTSTVAEIIEYQRGVSQGWEDFLFDYHNGMID